MIWPAVAILGFVTLQRLFEMRLADSHSRKLLAEGGVEHGREHYPFIVVLPLVFGLWQLAVLFSALNAIVLTVRIRAENRALASLRG